MSNAVTTSKPSSFTDNELVRNALAGRVSCFEELVERYRRPAFIYARAMIRNTDDALDLSQEAFIRVYRHLKRFDPAYPFKVWFFHILANLCKNHMRQRLTREKVALADEDDFDDTVADADSPEQAIQKTELQKAVWKAISQLPDKFRDIIILSHFQDMTYDQIAQVLEIPKGSVMSRLYYARLKLREILEQSGVDL